jgi:hypothetical protein
VATLSCWIFTRGERRKRGDHRIASISPRFLRSPRVINAKNVEQLAFGSLSLGLNHT